MTKPVPDKKSVRTVMSKRVERKLEAMLKDKQFVEAVQHHFLEAATTNYDFDERELSGYRRLSASKRDVSPLAYEKAMKLSFYQWQRNPLAQTLIRIPVDFCTGDDLVVKVKIKRRVKGGDDEDTDKNDAQQIFDDFYSDPVNNLENDLRNFVQDLLINGELVVPVAANSKKDADGNIAGNGKVRLGYMDPMNIKKAVTDPLNIRQVIALEMVPPNGTDPIIRKVIHVDVDPESETFEKRIGDTFFWRINYVTNQTRGNGELVPLLDWLDALDQFLFDALEGFRLRNAFFYQLEMQGLSETKLEEAQKKIKTPKTGTVRLVNDKAKWTTITPQLNSYEVNQSFKTLLTFVVGVGKTYPPHWFGQGEDSNLATSKVMTVPTMRMLRATQKVVRQILKDMAYYVIDQAVLAKTLTLGQDEYVECEVSMFDFEKADSAVVASALVQLVTSLTIAVDKKWVSQETARKVISGFVTRLGVEIDADAEAALANTDPDEDAAATAIDDAKKKVDLKKKKDEEGDGE